MNLNGAFDALETWALATIGMDPIPNGTLPYGLSFADNLGGAIGLGIVKGARALHLGEIKVGAEVFHRVLKPDILSAAGNIGIFQVKMIEGTFQNLAFYVKPNVGLKKNAVKEIRFYGQRYGSIFMLKQDLKYVAMIIASVPKSAKEKYPLYKNETIKIIENLKVTKYK